MTDPFPMNDEATQYVLGGLDEDRRKEFEARLAGSPDLRERVRELEEAALALALTSPRREPSRDSWARIEDQIAREENARICRPPFLRSWFRSRWAAAAAAGIVGWMLHALWVARDHPSASLPLPGTFEVPSRTGAPQTAPQRTERRDASGQLAEERDAALRLLQARMEEMGALRGQLSELTNQMTHIAQMLTYQQALLADASRIKFFQLGRSSDGDRLPIASLSTNLQRALFLAVARELGWLPPSGTRSAEIEGGQGEFAIQSGVDFVDLRPGSNHVSSATGGNPAPLDPLTQADLASLGNSTGPGIPGFVSGTNAVLAFEPAVITSGASLMFLTTTGGGQYINVGTATPGSNPLVVTVPFASPAGTGGSIAVLMVGAGGASNIIGQFPSPTP